MEAVGEKSERAGVLLPAGGDATRSPEKGAAGCALYDRKAGAIA